jgi:hypothetical protein
LDRRVLLALAPVALAAGCSDGGGGAETTTVAVPCNDGSFRAQDEELYVTRTSVSNAIGGGGAPATLLLDLRRARAALAGYVAAHPPCAEDLLRIAATEQEAIESLDAAIAALEKGEAAETQLAQTLDSLQSAQSALTAGQ